MFLYYCQDIAYGACHGVLSQMGWLKEWQWKVLGQMLKLVKMLNLVKSFINECLTLDCRIWIFCLFSRTVGEAMEGLPSHFSLENNSAISLENLGENNTCWYSYFPFWRQGNALRKSIGQSVGSGDALPLCHRKLNNELDFPAPFLGRRTPSWKDRDKSEMTQAFP